MTSCIATETFSGSPLWRQRSSVRADRQCTLLHRISPLLHVLVVRGLHRDLEKAPEVIPAPILDVQPLEARESERVAWCKLQSGVVRLFGFVDTLEVREG